MVQNIFQTARESLVSTPSKQKFIMQRNDENENAINRVVEEDASNDSYSNHKMHHGLETMSSSSISTSSSTRTKEEIGRDFEALVKGRYPSDDASDCGASLASFADFGRQQRSESFTKPPMLSLTTPIAPKTTHSSNYRNHSSVPPSATKFSGARSVIGTPSSDKPLQSRRGSVSSSSASAIVQRLVDSKPENKRNFTPIHIKPRISKKEVQATNEGYASVAKLSEWLASDPTSHKKLRHVRKGRNVILKSRKFEQDLNEVIVEEAHITKGAVSDKKAWLKQAFKEREEETSQQQLGSAFGTPLRKATTNAASSRYARSEIGGYRPSLAATFRTSELRESTKVSSSDSRSEIVTNDPAACASVSDKKDWLKNAFKSSSTNAPAKTSMPSKARSEIVQSNTMKRDDAAARAKERFLQRSARKQAENMETKGASRTVSDQESIVSETSGGASMNTSSVMQPEFEIDAISDSESRTGPPSVASSGSSSIVELSPQVEEDRTPVDFRSARQALINRSKKNGNNVNVVNKVFLRKEKFEKLEKMNKQKSNPYGLMKPSWDKASDAEIPSDAYTKIYVPDMAPKRSFEELP